MTRWSTEEPLSDEYVGDPPSPLVSLVYLRAALRRCWRTWAAGAVIGLTLAGFYVWHFPAKTTATVSLILQHPSGSDATSAMQTDVTMLRTRTVARRAVAALGLSVAPTDFLAGFSATATTPTVLTITLQAADAKQAVHRATTLATTYLTYRGEQLLGSTSAQLAGVQNQIASLRQQLTAARDQYAQFAKSPAGTSIATSALERASSLQAQIGSLNTSVTSAQDATEELINASTVLDPAAVVPASRLTHVLMTLVTGLVGGTAIGGGLVILSALTGTRLRRREDIAAAAGAPVTHSVRRLGTRRLPGLRRPASASLGVQILARGLESVAESPDGNRVALVTLDEEEAALEIASFAGARINASDHHVLIADLTRSGRLERHLRSHVGVALRPTVAPLVHRPDRLPALARGPMAGDGRPERGANDSLRAQWAATDVAITVASADLDAGLDHLAGWATAAVLLVRAGRSSAQRISSTAGLLRSAGIDVRAVLVIGTDHTDQSFGRGVEGHHHTDAGPVEAEAAGSADLGPRWAR